MKDLYSREVRPSGVGELFNFTDEFCSILAKVFNHFVHCGTLPFSSKNQTGPEI